MQSEKAFLPQSTIQLDPSDVLDESQSDIGSPIRRSKGVKAQQDGKEATQPFKEKVKFSWPVYRKLFQYTRRQWRFASMGIFFTILSGILTSLLPLKKGQILDAIASTADQNRQVFKQSIIVLVVLILLIVIAGVFRSMSMSLLQERIAIDMRTEIFSKFIKNDMRFFDEHKSGEFVSRLGADVNQAKSAISNNLAVLLKSVVTTIATLIMLIYISWRLSISMLILVPLFIYITTRYTKNNKSLVRKHRDIMAEMSAFIAQKFSGISIIKAFCAEDHQINQYNTVNERSYVVVKKKTLLKTIYNAFSELLPQLTTLIALYYGGNFIFDGFEGLTVGKLTSFLLYCTALNSNIKTISKNYSSIINGTHSVSKVFEMMNYIPEIDESADGNQGKMDVSIQGQIKFQNVSFSYPKSEVQVLKQVDISIKEGQYVAIVGQSGSGKSTFIKVLQKFYKIQQGVIRYGGYQSDSLNIKSIRSQISLVNQEATLFSGTILESITYGLEAYEESDVIQAAKQAGCYNFIMNQNRFPMGFQTQIGQRGSHLSGGQKQRIAIARALIRKPKILILDEATSALDTNSEFVIQKSIEKISKIHKKMAIIVIAHRLSTIRNAHRIIVMKEGEVVEVGSHSELRQQKGFYYSLVQKQLCEYFDQQLAEQSLAKARTEEDAHEKSSESSEDQMVDTQIPVLTLHQIK